MSAPESLRIVMTADAVGGVWQYATDLCAELADAGHRPVLALLGPSPTPAQREAAASISGLELVETGLPLDWLCPGPQPAREAAAALARLARELAADLVHCNSPSLAGAASFDVPVVAVAHGCVATWWQAARGEPLAEEFRWHRELTRRGLIAADAVVAPSASYAAIVQRVYGTRRAPIAVHNGRRCRPAAIAGGPTLRAALTVGRLWDEVKNARLMDAIAGRLEVPFLAAGALRGPHGEEFSSAHLHALGQVDDAGLATLLALRPVFVSAATFEPFGLAVLEAAAAGCPLVLSDIPTFRELWDGAALFADPHDGDAFVRLLAPLIDNPARRRELGSAAASRAARFTPAAAARRMEEIYLRVLHPAEAAA